ncbi:MAG: hydroxyisourate hydrolase [Acetobacteraceae bacterium]
MPGLSVHVVDVARGRPATGMRVEVYRLAPDRTRIAEGQLGPNGTLDHPMVQATLIAGGYEVIFHAGAFFADAALGVTDPPFLDQVPFRFNIVDPREHCHLPLKITPWGFSLYRGA